MVGTTVSVFTDPAESLVEELGGCQCSIVPTSPDPLRAKLIRIGLPRTTVLRLEVWVGQVAFIRLPTDSVIIVLPGDRETDQHWGGVPVRPGEILTIRGVAGIHARSSGHRRFDVICCSDPYLIRTGRRLIDEDFAVPMGVAAWLGQPGTFDALRSLFTAAIRVAEARPSAASGSQAARGLEQEIVAALVDCLSHHGDCQNSGRTVMLEKMACFEELLSHDAHVLPSLAPLCASLAVSRRTLRSYAQKQLGMTPSYYLRLRQLQNIRRELRDFRAGQPTTVSAVARLHGVRELGRFSQRYYRFFSELPSDTLRRRDQA